MGPPREPLLVLTIGQAPRDDIVGELRDVLGPDWPVEVRGALDGLDLDAVSSLTPTGATDALHTRLSGGVDVVVSKAAVTARLAALLDVDSERPTLVACTGRFEGLPLLPTVLYPSVIIEALIAGLLPVGGRLGVLVPLAVQIEPFAASWAAPDRTVTVVAVKPDADPTAAIAELVAAAVDLIVLDCFGYGEPLLRSVRAGVGRPVLSAVRCCAHLAQELLR